MFAMMIVSSSIVVAEFTHRLLHFYRPYTFTYCLCHRFRGNIDPCSLAKRIF